MASEATAFQDGYNAIPGDKTDFIAIHALRTLGRTVVSDLYGFDVYLLMIYVARGKLPKMGRRDTTYTCIRARTDQNSASCNVCHVNIVEISPR